MTEPNPTPADRRPSAAAGHPGPLSAHYRASRLRLRELVESLPPERLDDPVAACPGWSVHDVVAHLTANVEDAAAGRLSRPPGPEQTAEQVARHRDTPVAELFERWWAGAAAFEEGVDAFEIVPAVLDMLSHEHDVRAAVGRPGHRSDPGLDVVASWVLPTFPLAVPLIVELDGPGGPVEHVLGPPAEPGEEPLRLRTTAFEVVRFAFGRRTLDQMRALDWSADPGDLVEHLHWFGPAAAPLVE